MPTRSEKLLSEAEKDVIAADVELSKIPSGSPSFLVMRKLIQAMRLNIEVIRGLMPEHETFAPGGRPPGRPHSVHGEASVPSHVPPSKKSDRAKSEGFDDAEGRR